MKKMTDTEILAAVENEFESAMGRPGGEISLERAKALDYYLSKPLGDEIEGQSQVVTSDVSDVIDGIIPSLLRIFTTQDNLVSFNPFDPGDEESAQQESDYVNYVFFKEQEDYFEVLHTWFMDALIQKNGIIKAWWDDSRQVSSESYERLTIEELALLLEDPELEAEEQEEIEDEFEGTLYNVSFTRTCKGRVRIENVPPEEYRISNDARSINPSKARMVGQERELKRQDLYDMGFDKEIVDSIPPYSTIQMSEEYQSRRDKTDETYDRANAKNQDTVVVQEAYLKLDIKKNDKPTLHQVIRGGNEKLSSETVDRQPFHVICPHPLPHKHFGRSTAEKVMDILEVNTTLLRQTLMNLYHSNNPKHNVWEQAIGENTLDDMLSRRAGGINRFERPVGEAVSIDAVPFMARDSFAMIEYMDKAKRDRTGISSDSEGLSPEDLKHVQTTALSQGLDMSKQKIEAIARIFGETGIKSLFLHIHELLQKHQDKPKVVKLRNRWVEINPSEWRTRQNMTVNIGLGIGSREQNMIHLEQIRVMQKELIDAGGMGTLISPQNLWNTAAEFVKNANLKMPEMFFTDPNSLPPEAFQQQEQPDPQMMAIQANSQIEMAKIQQRMQELQVKHDEKMAELSLKNEEREDKLMVAIEGIKTDLTKLELDSGKNVPGSAV